MSSAVIAAHPLCSAAVTSIRLRCVDRHNRLSLARMAARADPVRVTEAVVQPRSTQVGLRVAPESRAPLAQHLAGLLTAVQLIDELELREPTEPAPRFEP